uniref:Immediate early response 2b n=1 Tax=Gadus morhua TaxID=8049 RepID=A0A8C5BXX2_GADMO
MDVNTEAKRILAVSISKLYASRSQRGGLRLHRSLLLSLVMRSARDIYHSAYAQAAAEEAAAAMDREEDKEVEEEEDMEDVFESETDSEDKENMNPSRHSRKRRGNTSAAPDFLPSKRARLEPGEERHAVLLGAVVPLGAMGLGSCRVGESLNAFSINRVAMPAC